LTIYFTAAKADLWRYLALWEYGGIYTGKWSILFRRSEAKRNQDILMAKPKQVVTTNMLSISFFSQPTPSISIEYTDENKHDHTQSIDMDNAPGELFNASTLTPDIDAFFLPEQGGFPSQYFFGAYNLLKHSTVLNLGLLFSHNVSLLFSLLFIISRLPKASNHVFCRSRCHEQYAHSRRYW